MKNAIVSLFLAVTFLSFLPVNAEDVNGVVFSLRNDNKKWKVANEANLNGQRIVQFVPEGESGATWSELFTVQTAETKIDPQTIFNLLIKEIHDIGPGLIVDSHVISNDDRGLFAEWWIKAASPIDQHEWIRIFNADDFTVIVRYTTKSGEKLEEKRKIWQPILGDAYFKGHVKQRPPG